MTMPPQLTSPSSGPSFDSALATAAAMDFGSARSSRIAKPAGPIAGRAAPRASSRMSPSATRAPSAARSSAVARPDAARGSGDEEPLAVVPFQRNVAAHRQRPTRQAGREPADERRLPFERAQE